MAVRANTGQSPNSVSMLGQRRIRLTGIEPAMDCYVGPTLKRYWVGRPTLCVPGISYAQLDQPQKVRFEINAVKVYGLLYIQESE